jgi:Carboxypeptidase regulatory-like domain
MENANRNFPQARFTVSHVANIIRALFRNSTGVVMKRRKIGFAVVLIFLALSSQIATAQQTQGSINGTVTDPSGAAIVGASVVIRNVETNLIVTAQTKSDGSFNVADLPIGNYEVTFSKNGFEQEVHSQILIQGTRVTTLNVQLKTGAVTSTVTVTGTPLLNQTDTTNGYILGQEVIQDVPLGTGSFTQLAILSAGVNADLLNSSGTSGGFGNQNIFANGQRSTSNSFEFNGVSANNIFNGNSSSSVSANRFVLNTGESFNNANGDIQTNTSVYDAIGQGLPTPPKETIQELQVNTSMYDASQGAHAGAQIELTTMSGANNFHGQLWEYHQTTGWNASPWFYNLNGLNRPDLHRNVFGGDYGGPIIKNRLFFFGSYQGQRVHDGFNGTSDVALTPSLTNARDPASIAAAVNADFGTSITAAQVNPVALQLLQQKTPDGGYYIPTPTLGNPSNTGLTYNAIIQGPSSQFNADQAIGDVDYDFSEKDRLAVKYFYQNAPTTSPFTQSELLGSPLTLKTGSQVISVDNTRILTPNLTWNVRGGFIRQRAFGSQTQAYAPSHFGISLFNANFPSITIDNADNNFDSFVIGPSSNFGNAGIFQNQAQGATSLTWVHDKHTITTGMNFEYIQLNVVNDSSQVASLDFHTFADFVTGNLRLGLGRSFFLNGESNRYYRARQAGSYVSDSYKLRPNLTITAGLRWDWNGPLDEKYGRLTNFSPSDYSYDLTTDTINNIGLVVAGNNKQFGTKGVSDSTLTGRQWGFAPRIGIAWSPSFLKNVVVRTGFGMYYDRGEYFTELSPSAGFGISGPFGVTVEQPFTVPVLATNSGTFAVPFGTTPPSPPPNSLAGVAALVPCQGLFGSCQNPQAAGAVTNGILQGANTFAFGGYDPANKLPYSENWTLDLQWQPVNSLLLDLAYVGNHGVHGTIPLPFNRPGIATAADPINGQTVSYGYQPQDAKGGVLLSEQFDNSGVGGTGGNTDLRTKYLGFNPNADFWEAVGVSHYNALQFTVTKKFSHGFQVNGSYTWSHSLDEQSGLGLFFNGNDPNNLHSAYGSSDFDRTHVLTVSYVYRFPDAIKGGGLASKFTNGWSVSGITVAQSGQPYSVYDFSGSAGGLFFSANDFITNPIIPATGNANIHSKTSSGAPLLLNPDAFSIQSLILQPGQDGVPTCGPTTSGITNFCDTVETTFGNGGRNEFRGPRQVRFDFSLNKDTKLTERFRLKFEVNAFNLFNHPSFDTPNNNVTFNPCFNPQPCYLTTPSGSLGVVQHTLGGPRFIQMAMHLQF